MGQLPEDPDREEPEEILEDLESIKDLLDEQQCPADSSHSTGDLISDRTMSQGDDVPLLDDPIEEAAKLHEALPDDTFKALLGDAWHDSVDEIFVNARASIQNNSADWLPEHTDELAQALKIRIDVSVKAWLAETLQANIGLLRERIVAELSGELLEQMREKLTSNQPTASSHTSPQTKKDNESDHG